LGFPYPCKTLTLDQGSRVLVRAKIIAYITWIYLKILFFHLKLCFWACINAYYIALEYC
jgi:hypothetical protein